MDFALRYGLVRNQAKAHSVRLADGTMVRTVGVVCVSVLFG